MEEQPPTPLTTTTAFDNDDDADICTSILTRFGKSTRDDHQHLCAVIGAMAQAFKDQSVSSSPVTYFGAAFSSLDKLLSEPEPSGHTIDALLTILSMAMRKVSPAILVKKIELLTGILVRALQCNSHTVAGAVSWLKCVSYFLIVSNDNNWDVVSQLYGFLLSFATDSRPKVRR